MKGLMPAMHQVRCSPLLHEVTEVALAKCDWKSYQEKFTNSNIQWTFTHNDAHPGNFMWDPKTKSILMIDMEFTGIGIGPADLMTFLTIRAVPEFRKKHERAMVELYYERLIASGRVTPESYTMEQCWDDYVFEGAARYVFYMPLFTLNWHLRVMTQEAFDRFEAFCVDHGINGENMRMVVL